MAVRKVNVMDLSTGNSRIQHDVRLGQCSSQWFLAEHVLAISEGSHGLFSMERIRSGDRHGLDIRLRTEFPIVCIDSGDIELFGYGMHVVLIPPTNGCDFGL